MASRFKLSTKHRREIRRIFSEAGVSRSVDDSVKHLATAAKQCWRVLQKGESLAIVQAYWSLISLKRATVIWEHCFAEGFNEEDSAAIADKRGDEYFRAVKKIWASKRKGNRAIRKLADEVNAVWVSAAGMPLPSPERNDRGEYWLAVNRTPTLLWLMLDAVGVDVGWRAVKLLTGYTHGKPVECYLE